MTSAPGTDPEPFVTLFDDTYDRPDCRAYFRMMDTLGYRNQHFATAAFRAALDEITRLRGLARPAVVDFASSYGVVTLLMRHAVTLEQVFARYRAPHLDNLSTREVIAQDRAWLAARRRPECAAVFTGIDVAGNALDYGVAAGLFEAGFAEDLERAAPSPALRDRLAQCDMIVECGSVAQLMPCALDRMLTAAAGRKPWVITSPIRGNERAAATQVYEKHGLVVERLPVPPFVHRRFQTPDEQARAIANARAAGHDTDGLESTGAYHAQLILARPADQTTPVSDWPRSPLAALPA